MIVETTVGKGHFLHMGTWLIPADRETSRKKRELRSWIRGAIEDTSKQAGIEFLPNGGFGPPTEPEGADLPVTIDFTTEQLGLIPAMFGRGVQWPNFLTDKQEADLDQLEEDAKLWVEQDKAKRVAKTLTKAQKKELVKEMAKETEEKSE